MSEKKKGMYRQAADLQNGWRTPDHTGMQSVKSNVTPPPAPTPKVPAPPVSAPKMPTPPAPKPPSQSMRPTQPVQLKPPVLSIPVPEQPVDSVEPWALVCFETEEMRQKEEQPMQQPMPHEHMMHHHMLQQPMQSQTGMQQPMQHEHMMHHHMPQQPTQGQTGMPHMQPPVFQAPASQGLCTIPVMAQVPVQPWGELYEAETGFSRGTIFPALDLPFLGKGDCRRG